MRVILLLMFASFFTLITEAQTWSKGPDIPVPVRASNNAVYSTGEGTWIYLVSGRSVNDVMTRKVQRLNTETLVWDTAAAHPTGMLGAAAAVLGDSLYCIGGVISPPGEGTQTVWKFNIKENSWGKAADFPVITADAKAVSYQDSIIIIGGGYNQTRGGQVYLYSANSNSWRPGTPIPSQTGLVFGGFTISGDTLVYLCGTSGFGSRTVYNTVYIGVIDQNDRSTISWRKGTNFPGSTRTFFDAVPWKNGIIMTGGSTDNTLNSFSAECYTYDAGWDVWTRLPDKPTPWVTGQISAAVTAGGRWKLFCISGYGRTGYLYDVEILEDAVTDVKDEKKEGILDGGLNVYPNPFNNRTQIRFTVAERSSVQISVFDMLGNEVRRIEDSEKEPGTYELHWDGADNRGMGTASGIYYARFTAGGRFAGSMKMIYLK